MHSLPTYPLVALSLDDIANNLVAEAAGIVFTVIILAWLLNVWERRRWRTARHFVLESVIKATNLISAVIAEGTGPHIPEFEYKPGVPPPSAREGSRIVIRAWDDWLAQNDAQTLASAALLWNGRQWQSCADEFERARTQLANLMVASAERLGPDTVGEILRVLEDLEGFESSYSLLAGLSSQRGSNPLFKLGVLIRLSQRIPAILQDSLSLKREAHRVS